MSVIHPFFFTIFLFLSCSEQRNHINETTKNAAPITDTSGIRRSNGEGIRTIHVFLALCDNKYQGIVPVPARIGNGQDPKNNLYWGAANGVKTYFTQKSEDWQLISSQKNISEKILERLLFKHRSMNTYMLADAYDGRFIKETQLIF